MKIMLYCQHVLGLGHFFRSMRIAAALNRHDVLFVEGGSPLNGFTPPPHVQRAFLPPLMMDAEFSKMETYGGEDLAEIAERRKRLLQRLFRDFAPDVLLIELYPFGRKRFGFELTPLLQAIRGEDARTRVICSLRDILVEKEDQSAYEERVLKSLNPYFDLLLVHSDPELIRLDDTFSRTADIRIPVRYTGYVVQPANQHKPRVVEKTIVASSGGGRVGVDLLAATVRAVRGVEDSAVRLRIFIGPFMEDSDRELLAQLASGDSRITLSPFSLDFPAELANADLSISMAGYNTCMDILSVNVRALVYPFPQNREQAMRAGKFAERGILDVVEDLTPESLAAQIQKSLADLRPGSVERSINISGAENTALEIERFFGEFLGDKVVKLRHENG
jgi:predicted glycosyltransferase